MPVTGSSFAYNGPAQADGTRLVIESHTLPDGSVRNEVYFAPQGSDPSIVLAQRAAQLNLELADAEVDGNMTADAKPINVEVNVTTFLLRLREVYKASSQANTCRIAWWILRRIAAGHLTNAQFQTAFSVTATQWTNFKTNTLTPQSNAWAAVIAATGS